MDARYLEALVNEDGKHVVLGRTLHPFCFYDILFLEIDQNPLWLHHRPIGWGDLIVATLVCSIDSSRYLTCANPKNVLARAWRMLWIVQKKWKYLLPTEVDKFQAYVEDYWTRPRMWTSDDGKKIKLPWTLSVISYVEAHSNYTEDQLMRMSAGLVMWKAGALAELLHEADPMSEEEEEAIAALGMTLK